MLTDKEWSQIRTAWLAAKSYELSRTYVGAWVKITVKAAPPCWRPAKAIIRLEYRGPLCSYSSQWFDHVADVRAALERMEGKNDGR